MMSHLPHTHLSGGRRDYSQSHFPRASNLGPEIAMYSFIWLSWFCHGKALSLWNQPGLHKDQKLPSCACQKSIGSHRCNSMAGHRLRSVLEYGRTYLEQFCDRANGHGYANSRMDHQFGGTLGWAFSMLRIVQRLWLVLFQWDFLENERTNNYLSA